LTDFPDETKETQMSEETEPTVHEQSEEAVVQEAASEAEAEQEAPTPEAPLSEREVALTAEAASLKDRYLRLSADFDNSRKRSAREVEDRVARQRDKMVRDWLEVLDSVERALAHAPERSGPWYEGTVGIHRLLVDVLSRHGVEAFAASGEPFDPKIHEAIGMIEDPDQASGSVAHVQTTGFRSSADDRIIRPAQVIVVK
jgi:molecular chaperone GrpE